MHYAWASPLHLSPKPELQFIELTSSLQIPYFYIIGLPSQEVSEAKERIRNALLSSGFEFPNRKIVVNLAPAGVRKKGTSSDLAIALSVLTHQETKQPVSQHNLTRLAVASGELGLDGTLKPCGYAVRSLSAAAFHRAELLVLHPVDFNETRSWLLRFQRAYPEFPLPNLITAKNLKTSWEKINHQDFEKIQYEKIKSLPDDLLDPSHARSHALSQDTADLLPLSRPLQKLLGITASGKHHLLLLGAKGVGKSKSLEWLKCNHYNPNPHLLFQNRWLTELSSQSSQTHSNRVHSTRVIGPHVRPQALLGGFSNQALIAGEYALANGGLLIADEYPEWARDSRETLRHPLEEGEITLNRLGKSITLPTRFQFIGTGNLCPCGGIPKESESEGEKCRCRPKERELYLKRLSGPVLDRIDLIYRIFQISYTDVQTNTQATPSFSEWAQQVEDTKNQLLKTWGLLPGDLDAKTLEHILSDHPMLKNELHQIRPRSLRMRHKILKTALTCAAWDQHPIPQQKHFLEAHFYKGDWLSSPS